MSHPAFRFVARSCRPTRPARALMPLVFATCVAVGCLAKERRMLVEAPLQDFVDHGLLAKVGLTPKELPERKYDPKIGAFVSQFLEDARKRGVNVAPESLAMLRQVIYVDQISTGNSPGVMAVCNRYFMYQGTLEGRRRVRWTTIEVLRKESQDYTGDDPTREQILLRELMYHEIFHCLLNKGHLPAGVQGIMSATFTKDSRRSFEDWVGLVNDMFSPRFMELIPDATFE